jgi:hypothetical protein
MRKLNKGPRLLPLLHGGAVEDSLARKANGLRIADRAIPAFGYFVCRSPQWVGVRPRRWLSEVGHTSHDSTGNSPDGNARNQHSDVAGRGLLGIVIEELPQGTPGLKS